VASSFFLLDLGATRLGFGSLLGWIILDFGCGPLTLGIALAWHSASTAQIPHSDSLPLLSLIGIERSQAMIDQAERFAQRSGLFHQASTPLFLSSFLQTEDICYLIDCHLSAVTAHEAAIILNFCYFFESRSLDVNQLADVVNLLVKTYSRTPIWILYQNPTDSRLGAKWRAFKSQLRGFRQVAADCTIPRYFNTTNRKGQVVPIKLSYEVLRYRPIQNILRPTSAAPRGLHAR
jgi:hypothetical protein